MLALRDFRLTSENIYTFQSDAEKITTLTQRMEIFSPLIGPYPTPSTWTVYGALPPGLVSM